MSAIVTGTPRAIHGTRRAPAYGEVGCPGSCPLCTTNAGTSSRPVPPCLACREELRARLSEMQLARYAEMAVN